MKPAQATTLLVAGIVDALIGAGFGVWAATGAAPQSMWIVAGTLLASGLVLVFVAARARAASQLEGQ